jgi:hypothetical protein
MITTENTLLVEFIPGKQGHVEAPVHLADGSVSTYFGLKVKRVVDGECNILSDFDVDEDCCKIDCLRGREGNHVVTVAAPDNYHDNFHWIVWVIDEINPDTTQLVFKNAPREATEEEVVQLNNMFPGYLEACYFDEEESLK